MVNLVLFIIVVYTLFCDASWNRLSWLTPHVGYHSANSNGMFVHGLSAKCNRNDRCSSHSVLAAPVRAFSAMLDDADNVFIKKIEGAMDDRYCANSKCMFLNDSGLKNMPITLVMHTLFHHQHRLRMEYLKLNNNKLFGVIKWQKIPPNLKLIDFSNNDISFISSSAFCERLPSNLQHLYLHQNRLCEDREFPWYLLPDTLQVLTLHKTGFIGPIQFNQLPSKLKILTVSWRVNEVSHGDRFREWIPLSKHSADQIWKHQMKREDALGNSVLFIKENIYKLWK